MVITASLVQPVAESETVAPRDRWAGRVRIAEVLIAGSVMLVCLYLVHLAARHHPAPVVSPTLSGLATPWAMGMLGLLGVGYVVAGRRYARLIIAAIAGVAAAWLTFPLTAGLLGTDQPLGSVLGGDNSFRTEYVTRFASSAALQDYMFHGEGAFYPPGWFWVVGRFAALTGAEPWRLLQPATLVTMALSLVASFVLWRLAVRPPVALAAAIVSSVTISQISSDSVPAWYSPYSAFVAVVLVPWVVAVYGFVSGGRATRSRAALLVAAGAVLALTYYLLFLIGLAALAVALVPVAARRRPGAWLRLLLILGGVATLTAVFWVPLAQALFSGTATQGTFFVPEFLDVDTGFQDGGAAIAVIMVTAAVLLFLTRRAAPSRVLICLAAGAILYQTLSAFTLAVAHQQMQPQRAATLLWATAAASLPVALEMLGKTVLPSQQELLPARIIRPVVGAVAVLLLLPMLTVTSDFAAPMLDNDLVKAAHPAFDPTDADALATTITTMTGASPQDLVVATDDSALLAIHPFWGFLPWNVHYAHPGARIVERVQFLQTAAACPDATCFNRAMNAGTFERIDAFVVRKDENGLLHLGTALPGFPAPQPVTIDVEPRLLSPQQWSHVTVAGYAVYVAVT